MASLSEPRIVAEAWLSSFASALISRDARAVANVFLSDGWLRDILTFTWDNRSLEGRDKIIDYLADTLPDKHVSEIQLSEEEHFRPVFLPMGSQQGLEFGYTFETSIAHGKGLVRLLQDDQQEWKALVVSTVISDLKGYEEVSGRLSFEDSLQEVSWGVAEEKRRAQIESNPYVLIVGAGQTGLNVAARFKQMNIPALVIERNERVGDIWRQRYLSLALHTIREHHQMLYHHHPSTWPLYTPRDKVANMLETYAVNQELVVWTSSLIKGRPVFDADLRQWTVTIDRNGAEVVVRPAHIVLATGTWGGAKLPALPGREAFRGISLHASQYSDPRVYKGMEVVVIGAGNSSIDICQDLVGAGAKSVTMVQRSSTCVVSRANVARHLGEAWTHDTPTEVADFKFGSIPLAFQKKMMMSQQAESWAEEEELHAKLRKGGLNVNIGPEGQGQFLLVFERGGGYWLDKGGADLIASGDIKVKQGTEPTAYTSNGLLFSDHSELTADAIIFATGYVNMREINKKIFGPEVIDQTSDVWGLDDEGELRGSYRPSGYPGLWYATGDFFNSRFQSKQLALQIKATELGLVKT